MTEPVLNKEPDEIPGASAGGNFIRCRSQWSGLLAIAAVFVGLAALSWRKWADPLIDFGQQLYVPWRLSRGAILYHDVSYVYGCLSVCYHAALFKIFGVSLNVILASNFLILIFLLLLIYGLFLKSSDVLTATTVGLALTVLAFSQLLDVANYNYLCPYSHEEFHGVVLAVLMMAFLSQWLQKGWKWPVALSGVCLGMIFLTKPEVFVGALAPFFVALLLRWRQASVLELGKSFLLALAAGLIPLAGFYLGFRSEMNSADALRAVFGAWLPLLHSTGLNIPIYRAMTGMDAPLIHIGQALVEFGGLAVIVGFCIWRLTRPTLKPLERAVIFALAGGLSLNYGWQKCGHCLPLLVLIAVVLWWLESRRNSEFGIRNSEFVILWLSFSFFLLAKLGFNPKIAQYGVFLAMPAFLSAFYLLLHLLPHFLERRGLDSKSFRIAMLIFLLAGLARLTIQSALFYKDKDFTLGSGGDRIVTYNPNLTNPKIAPVGAAMASAANWIETHTAPTNTLAVLPEGVMLNYLTRRDNPTPYCVFAFEVWAYGEENMLAAYKQHPPDYIVLVQRDSSEYGVPYFGLEKGYGYDVMQWVRTNYRQVYLIGAVPLQPGGAFGVEILKRLPLVTPAN
ncbi:MAG TPA: hypothetical protein VFY06_13315 [Verrucomicrobiae bacterium]|nr:hypothetical protein [Verrucomicrobiae bacterium]